MKLPLFSYLLTFFFAVVAVSIAVPKAIIVTYPDDTPDFILEQARDAITHAGGIISHEYKLLRGFAAEAPAKAIEAVNALSTEYLPVIEEDSIVSINGDLISGGRTE